MTQITKTGMIITINIGVTAQIIIRAIHRSAELIRTITITGAMDQTSVPTTTQTIITIMGIITTQIIKIIIEEETEITVIITISQGYTL